ncbi:MAG TPA: hypothetical protein VIO61_01025 [Anaerolineaceae bacterium]
MEDAPRVGVTAGDHVVERQPVLGDCREQQGQRRLQPREAGHGTGGFLFCQGVGGVVGGEAVDHIEVVPERLHIGRRSQAWAHLAAPAQARQVGFREEQVVRRHLAGDRQPLLLGGADHQDFLAARHVTDVHGALAE